MRSPSRPSASTLVSRALLLVLLAALAACGKRSKNDDDDDQGGAPSDDSGDTDGSDAAFVVPNYSTSTDADHAPASDVAALAPNVRTLQKLGKLLAALAARNGKLTLDDGKVVHLTSIHRNACPDDVDSCTPTDSSTLGIPSSALVASYDDLRSSIRDQGDRGTCVAFATAAAIEILLARTAAADLSEQHIYFLGRSASGSWDAVGLDPMATIQSFATSATPIADESSWPYNPDQSSCAAYSAAHPDKACSPTEAQGSADGRTPDPATASATHKILRAHQLYASLGRIKQALARGYPVVMGVNANIDFTAATKKKGVISWVFKEANCGTDVCGHAVTAVGYQDDDSVEGGGYLVIKNSWGTTWGNAGLAFATYTWVENSLLDAQAVVEVE